jgi:glutathione synthase/RimK-type ligase-like ATP-grasp enzyme
MRIALASCSDLPDWEVDDHALHRALEARGVEHAVLPWDAGVDWAGFDAVLLRTTWDYHRRHEAFVAWCAAVEGATRLFNPAAVVRWNTDKLYLRELAAHGVPLAPTVWIPRGSAPDAAALLGGLDWGRAFIKPIVGANASDTLRFSLDAAGLRAAQEHLDGMLGRTGAMVQPYLDAVEREGERSAILVDGQVTHCVRKVPAAGDYRVQDDWGASDGPTSFDQQDLEVVRGVLAAAAVVCPEAADLLYARVDLLPGVDGAPVLAELEVVEPSLFLRHGPWCADRLADALLRRLGGGA